jgi:PhnB protein
MRSANPYLNFNGNTYEAFKFYRSVFGGEFAAVLRFSDFGTDTMGASSAEREKIAHIALSVGDSMLMGTDVLSGMPQAQFGTNFLIALSPESAEETHRAFGELSADGDVLMPLQKTGWSELHGHCRDRFGVQWILDYTGNVKFDLPRHS